jgi:cell filamentation protein
VKVSIRFYKDREVRVVWDEENAKWWFAAVDVAAVLSESDTPANYWRVLKTRLNAAPPPKKNIINCNAFKLKASDGKMRRKQLNP